MKKVKVLGLDIETSTGDPEFGTILSIGCYDPERTYNICFYEEIRHKRFVAEPAAFAVNKFMMADVNSEKKISLSNVTRP